MPKTFASLFSCGGGADLGAIAAGLTHLWGLEIDPKIAEIYEQNIGEIHCLDILDANPSKFTAPDWLHASPVCKQFSAANSNKGERAWDIKCGHKVAEFIEVLQPKYFSLENVRAYRDSRSFQIIVEALNANGYHCSTEVINAADYGVAQSRERLFLIAYRGDFRWGWTPFTGKTKRMGWYQAIADLLPYLPVNVDDYSIYDTVDISFLPHGVQREIAEGGCVAIETIGKRSDRTMPLIAFEDDPIWTIRALSDEHWWKFRWFVHGLTGLSTIEMAARLQGFPDDYQWSGHKATDGTIIGNSVCPPVMKHLIQETINYES